MFSELASLAAANHSEFLGDPSATYQYRAAQTQTFTVLDGVVELGEVVEFRKSQTGTNRVMLLPIRVTADQFDRPPIIGGQVRITKNGTSVDYQIEHVSRMRSSRIELKLQRFTINQIHRPGYQKR